MIKINKILIVKSAGTMPLTYTSELLIMPNEISYDRSAGFKNKSFKWQTTLDTSEFNTLYFNDDSRDYFILDKNNKTGTILPEKNINVFDAVIFTIIVEYDDNSVIHHQFIMSDKSSRLKLILNTINNLLPKTLPVW